MVIDNLPVTGPNIKNGALRPAVCAARREKEAINAAQTHGVSGAVHKREIHVPSCAAVGKGKCKRAKRNVNASGEGSRKRGKN